MFSTYWWDLRPNKKQEQQLVEPLHVAMCSPPFTLFSLLLAPFQTHIAHALMPYSKCGTGRYTH